eukprot:TRINITY_DN989_c0_g1_i1.p1 TRINITY_DN989_c0_g1~~TRINITY_DN989_c0_g1_i1.p1  ORF type:complete len:99 (+),score=5.48 TRINITY_DN989_c0_g1_i1:257-553(+)
MLKFQINRLLALQLLFKVGTAQNAVFIVSHSSQLVNNLFKKKKKQQIFTIKVYFGIIVKHFGNIKMTLLTTNARRRNTLLFYKLTSAPLSKSICATSR